jgi:HSP20 family molecular chaperone IbpA
MFELVRWKDEELKNLKKDLLDLMERFMNLYGIGPEDFEGRLWHSIQICEDEGRLFMEVETPALDPDTLRIYLTGNVLIITAMREVPHFGVRPYRKRIELPFTPKEGEIQVNYKPNRLSIMAIKPRKKVYRLHITAM